MKIYYRSNKTIMKIYSYSKSILGVIFAAALLIGPAHAQTFSIPTGSEVESTGTITEYTPGSALVLDIGTGEPVQFKLSKNLRIRVHYLKVGGDNVVDKATLLEN